MPQRDQAIDRRLSARRIAVRIETVAPEIAADFAGPEKLVLVRLPAS